MVAAAAEKDRLISLQFASRDFYGDDHEAYHQCNIRLGADLDAMSVAGKTVLNRLARPYGRALPHELRRGINTGSFGKFLNSLKDPAALGGNDDLRVPLLQIGESIDDGNNEYRDKFIEHLGETDVETGFDFVGNGVRKIHTAPVSGPTAAMEDSSRFGYISWLVPGGEILMVHVVPAIELTPGVRITQGDIIGHVSDGDKGHFTVYGGHIHLWGSRGLPDGALELFLAQASVVGRSPEATGLRQEAEDYVALSLNSLRELNPWAE